MKHACDRRSLWSAHMRGHAPICRVLIANFSAGRHGGNKIYPLYKLYWSLHALPGTLWWEIYGSMRRAARESVGWPDMSRCYTIYHRFLHLENELALMLSQCWLWKSLQIGAREEFMCEYNRNSLPRIKFRYISLTLIKMFIKESNLKKIHSFPKFKFKRYTKTLISLICAFASKL